MPAIAEPEVAEEKIIVPPTVQINKMSDRFKEAMAKGTANLMSSLEATAEKPAEKPPEKTAEKPAEKPTAPEVKSAWPLKDDKKEKPKIPAENFKILETQRDEFRAKHEAAEAKARELEAKLAQAVDPAKIAELQKKLDETHAKATQFETIVERFYVEHDPKFQAAFGAKIEQSRLEAKESVGVEHGAKIESLLKMPPSPERDKAIEDVGDELRPYQQTALVKAYSDLRRTERERDGELAKSSENFKKIQSFNAEQSQKEQQAKAMEMENAFKTEAATMMTRLPDFRVASEEDKPRVQKNIELAREFLSADTPADRARIALYAARGFSSIATDLTKDALIDKLTKQVQELQAAGPTLQGGGKAGAEKNAAPKTAAEKFKEAREHGIPAKE